MNCHGVTNHKTVKVNTYLRTPGLFVEHWMKSMISYPLNWIKNIFTPTLSPTYLNVDKTERRLSYQDQCRSV